MAKDSPPSFQFYPHDFAADPAVRLMSPEARGGYIMLLCAAWWQREPGVVPVEFVQGLSELPPERWKELESQVARAFDTTSRPGFWVQRRMVAERKAQARRHENASKGARVTNDKRWGSVANESLDGRCQRQDSESLFVSHSSSSSSSSSNLEPKSSCPPPVGGGRERDEAAEKKRQEAREDRQAWEETFPDFWDEYPVRGEPPRKDGKAEALKAWMKIEPTEANAKAIWRGLDLAKAAWTDPKFIPMAATWLNKGRWRDGF